MAAAIAPPAAAIRARPGALIFPGFDRLGAQMRIPTKFHYFCPPEIDPCQ